MSGAAQGRSTEASPATAVTRAAPHRRLVYLGTPDTAVHPLRALVADGFEISLVVTRTDKRRGRGSQLMPSPVKAAAVELGLPVSHSVDDALVAGADLGVVVAFGQLIKPHVLEALPMVNLHFSLLPRWRGAAPVERALLAGDARPGCASCNSKPGSTLALCIAVQPFRSAHRSPPTSCAASWSTSALGCCSTNSTPVSASPSRKPVSPRTRQRSVRRSWRSTGQRPPVEIDRLVRVGGAWTMLNGRRLKIIAAQLVDETSQPSDALTGDRAGGLRLLQVHPEGKPPMSFDAFARGAHLAGVEHLGRAE